MLKKILKVDFFILCFIVISTAFAASNDPLVTLRSVANQMIAGLKAHQATLKTKPQIVYDLANQYVVPHADLDVMSKHVLPPHIWNSASAAQRSEFKKEFTRTLIRTYASALTSYQDQTVRFYPVRGGNGATVVVNSDISSPNNGTIHVAYRLIRTAGNWKLYDMSVEGVSMLESFRSQFSDILSQGTIQQLIDRMRSHNVRKSA